MYHALFDYSARINRNLCIALKLEIEKIRLGFLERRVGFCFVQYDDKKPAAFDLWTLKLFMYARSL
jgi:hypothetical protein